ncbi:MAG: murein hydrolase activator EnvC family protein [Actinomycetota bacterium]
MRGLRALRERAWVLPVLVLSLAALALPATAGPHDRLDSLENKKAEAQRDLARAGAREKDVSAALADLDEQRVAAEARVVELDVELDRIDGRIAETTDRLERAQVRLAVLHQDLLKVQRRLVHRTELFTDRARAAYMAGPTAAADSLLSSETFAELVDRYSYYESALDADSELVESISVLRDQTEAHRDLVENRKDEIASAKLRLEADRDAVAALRAERAELLAQKERAVAEKEAILSGVKSRQARLKQLIAQYERESAEIEALLAGGSSGSPHGTGQLLWPANGPVTSGYGYRTHPIFGDQRFHSGIDIGAPYGAPVFAADSGTVAFVGAMSGYGNVVVIDHGGGLATTYNHLSGFYVGDGQRVGRGTTIAAVGCTGYCTGPHLHFEVRVNGSPVDPMPYLQ